MRKSYWLAVLAYRVPTFPWAYFWHPVTFADRYHRLEMYRHEVIILLGLASAAIQALVLAWACTRLFPAGRVPWRRGAVAFGCTFGVMAWSFLVLPVAASYRMTSVQDFIVLETCFTASHFAVVSPLIAWVYRLGVQKSVSAVWARSGTRHALRPGSG